MESAGRSAAEVILERADFKRPLVVAGRGGNGGDALVVARHLFESGADVTALALCRPEDLSPTTALMARRLEEVAPGRLRFLAKDLGPLEERLAECDGVIDGLFGSGLDRPLAGRETPRPFDSSMKPGARRSRLTFPRAFPPTREPSWERRSRPTSRSPWSS